MGAQRVLLRADGSHAIGLGHVTRSAELGRFLLAQGREVLAVGLRDQASAAHWSRAGIPARMFEEGGEAALLEEVLASFSPQAVVLDLLGTDEGYLRWFKSRTRVPVISLDDTRAGLVLADAVVNGFAFSWGAYDPVRARARLYEGPPYMILSPDIAVWRERPRPERDRAERLLLAFGGTDTHFLTERVLAALDAVPGPLSVLANLGPGSRETEGLRRAASASPHAVSLRQGLPDLFQAMCEADLAVCAGGNMLIELAALGVPAAAVAAETHEVKNVRYWAGRGSALDLGYEREFDPAWAAGAIAGLLADPARLKAMAAAGREAVDLRGAERVAAIVEELAP